MKISQLPEYIKLKALERQKNEKVQSEPTEQERDVEKIKQAILKAGFKDETAEVAILNLVAIMNENQENE